MQRMKNGWKRLPDKPRRILTLILGTLLIIASALIGWIPGPGGMIPFLLGIAILATEFEWAERFRDWILVSLKRTAVYIRSHLFVSTVAITVCMAVALILAYVFYTHIL